MAVLLMSQLSESVSRRRQIGKKIVLTAGVFDLFHVGHVKYLCDAAALGDYLVVGVNSDALVKKMKGQNRPIIPGKYRAEVVAAIKGVDNVVIFDDINLLITLVNPDILVVSSTTSAARNEEKRHIAGDLGIKVVEFGNSHPDMSTSQIMERIKKS
ncbi:MAG: adenylyltransferase/cytidyltransferase family protein [Candidatus Parcubacteria bacterium]|nr:adenylyltransferase/cytidyltransferase family protein [Candidatus Parcubacteria bacterium]